MIYDENEWLDKNTVKLINKGERSLCRTAVVLAFAMGVLLGALAMTVLELRLWQ